MSVENLKQEAISSNSSPQRLEEIAAISCELASLVASNPNANSQLLNELAVQARNNRDLETQRAIALNPNTSKKLLVELAYKFPEEFFANPIYDLSILTNINISRSFPRKLLAKLVLAINAPPCFLSFAASISSTNGENLIIIASHRNTSTDKLVELFSSRSKIVAEIAKIRLEDKENHQDKDISFWIEIVLRENPTLINLIPRKLIYKLVQKPHISSDFLSLVFKNETATGILYILANHSQTFEDVLKNLTSHNEVIISEAAKLHIKYSKRDLTDWKNLAKYIINRNQINNVTDSNTIEARLWKIGIIDKTNIFYLYNCFSESDIGFLFDICSDIETPKYLIDSISYFENSIELLKECIKYLQNRNNYISNSIPNSLTKNIESLASRFWSPRDSLITNIDNLFKTVEDIKWRKRKVFIRSDTSSLSMLLVDLIYKETDGRQRKWSLQELKQKKSLEIYKAKKTIVYELSNLEYYGLILAHHPKTSSQILAELTQHILKEVRVLVARHPNITQNSLYNLISDLDPEVREAALANSKLDATFKQEFVRLENNNLSLSELQELASSKYKIIREKVALHPNVDRDILIKLSDDKFNVRIAVAKNPQTPTNILLKYVTHPNKRLHFAVAENYGAPLDLLIKLGTQQDPKNQNGYHFNPQNLIALRTLLKHYPDDAIPVLDKCLKYPDRPSYARFLVLMNPNISSKFLARYYKSWFWIERYAIAQNPNTDIEIRQYLVDDCNCLVRAAARSFLE